MNISDFMPTSGIGLNGWFGNAGTYLYGMQNFNPGTYAFHAGDSGGAGGALGFTITGIPSDAILDSVQLYIYTSGSSGGNFDMIAHLGGNQVTVFTVFDAGGTTLIGPTDITRPGGGSWAVSDLPGITIVPSSNDGGNGNPMKIEYLRLRINWDLGGGDCLVVIQ